MCGIVGYVGPKSAQPILIDGLKRLEYRGYDSAGLAFLENGEKFGVVRAEGKLDQLLSKIGETQSPATLGIGHTRWATHGRPSEVNAHPHHSRDVVLVHNGIIENYLEIKKELLARGHKFTSETDTEVICHLIQDLLDQKQDFFTAFKTTLSRLHGAYSLVILHRQTPGTIFVAKKGSPLVIGLKTGESFVASDVPAILPHTNQVVFLEDGECAVLTQDGGQFYKFSGEAISKPAKTITWTAAQAEKGGYRHFMLKEIMEQPRALADTLTGRIDQTALMPRLEEIQSLLVDLANRADFRIHIVACGTSWHSGQTARYWIEQFARVPVSIDVASEYRYRTPVVTKSTLVIAISQSGETADTLAAAQLAKEQGASVLAICNVVESSLARLAQAALYTHAGPEIGVASTKAFTTQMAVLNLLALKLAQIRQTLTVDQISERTQALTKLPNLLKAFLRDLKGIDKIAEEISRRDHCYYLGRGVQYPIVLEAALKLKEISYVHAEGYAGGEMKHGPIALIEENVPVFAVAVHDAWREKMLSNIEEIRARGGRVFAMISEGDALIPGLTLADHIVVPKAHEDVLPFLTVVPFQILAYEAAVRKGTDVDQPRNLAKSVTVE